MSEAQPEAAAEEGPGEKKEKSSQRLSVEKTAKPEEKRASGDKSIKPEDKRVSLDKAAKLEEAPERRGSQRVSLDKSAKPEESPAEKKDKSRTSIDKMSKTKIRSSLNMGSRSLSRLKVRKASFGFGSVPGIRPVERTSQVAIEFKRPPLIYLNTYQLDSSFKFHIPMVEKAIENLLDEHFTGHKYSIAESPIVAMRVAGELLRLVKLVGFNRYRLIAVVTLGQKRAGSYNNAVAFLWDHERDNYVNVQREVTTAFIQIQDDSADIHGLSQQSVTGICISTTSIISGEGEGGFGPPPVFDTYFLYWKYCFFDESFNVFH